MTTLRRSICVAIISHAVLSSFSAYGGEVDCGSLANAFGPYDYRDSSLVGVGRPRDLVETAHFTPDVQSLTKGNTADRPDHDLDYTLRAFPNHHQALYSMINYYTDALASTRPPMRWSAECYLDRAERFQPDDEVVWMLDGVYLSRVHRLDEALAKYKHAEVLRPDSPEVHYNIGLVYLQLHRTDEALKEARLAYDANYPLMGLKNKLKKLGVWTEP
jgi:tetratricopeptide (TPR) repeat protein